MAILLITHDLGRGRRDGERVVVMYAGRKVEEAPVAALFAVPVTRTRGPASTPYLGSVPPRAGAAALDRDSGHRAVAVGTDRGCPSRRAGTHDVAATNARFEEKTPGMRRLLPN